MIRTFADLLSPVTPGTFFADACDRQPLHIPGDPGKFDSVMSWGELTGLLNQAALWTGQTLQLVMDKRVLPAPEYCRPGRTRDGGQAMLADLEKVRAWVKRGASIVLNEIDTLSPGVRGVAKALEGAPAATSSRTSIVRGGPVRLSIPILIPTTSTRCTSPGRSAGVFISGTSRPRSIIRRSRTWTSATTTPRRAP